MSPETLRGTTRVKFTISALESWILLCIPEVRQQSKPVRMSGSDPWDRHDVAHVGKASRTTFGVLVEAQRSSYSTKCMCCPLHIINVIDTLRLGTKVQVTSTAKGYTKQKEAIRPEDCLASSRSQCYVGQTELSLGIRVSISIQAGKNHQLLRMRAVSAILSRATCSYHCCRFSMGTYSCARVVTEEPDQGGENLAYCVSEVSYIAHRQRWLGYLLL